MRYIIILTCLTGIVCSSCDVNTNSHRDTDPVIYLTTLEATPNAPDFEKNIYDRVAVVNDSGEFYIDGRVLDKADTAYLIGTKVGRSNLTEWVNATDYKRYHSSFSVIQGIIIDAYEIRIGEGRLSKIVWLSGKNIYPAPWINIDTLKQGDSVIIQRFGDFEPYKGVLTQDVKERTDYVIIKYNEYNGSDAFDFDEVFIQKHPAQLADIRPGAIMYFDKMYWVMVLGTRDDTHIIVRQNGFPAKDMIVPISKLEVYK